MNQLHHVGRQLDTTAIGPGRILLAEDGIDNQRLIALLLSRAGYEVILAEDGQQAMELALGLDSIDLILMDMQMPILDGLTATGRLRAAGYSQPIIALTANAMQQDREQCLAAGCNDFATKPIEKAKLFATIERWMSCPSEQDA